MNQATILYISASTNRHPHAADVSPSFICFASHKTIALWDASVTTFLPRLIYNLKFSQKGQTESGVLSTLCGHRSEVICVRFLRNDECIVSGDKDGILQIRMKMPDKWKVVIEQVAHTKSITALTTYDNIIVTGSSDATVKIWRFKTNDKAKGSLDLVQSLDMKGKYPLDVQLTVFPGTHSCILAIASTAREIDIWTGSDHQFSYSTSLPGHEDWVKCLAFCQSRHSPPQLTLASGSQDGTIRLWTFDHIAITRPIPLGDDIIDAFEPPIRDFSDAEEGDREMIAGRYVIPLDSFTGSHHLSVVFDALLVGHEAGITSLSWRPERSDYHSSATLMSTSTDSSLILWSPVSLSGPLPSQSSGSLWINQQRFGDVGGQRLGGFVGGLWTRNGCDVLGWGWNGGWRRWRCQSVSEGHAENWEEVVAITGHQGVITSIAWASNGEYLISTGLDQTTRIHGPYRQHLRTAVDEEAWHELARPQIHGYDIVCAEFLSPLRFVSIADEKVVRVFDAPKSFVETLNSLGMVRVPLSTESRPTGANVPPLGLSNKAITDDLGQSPGALSFAKRRPFESELGSMTLWPEIEKIYGHGYELISMAVSHSGSLLVTACKSTTAEHAVLRVYDTKTWQIVGEPLAGHTLTVTSIALSPDDKMILSVSRDRTWRLFMANPSGEGYTPLAMSKAHGRIIWDCAWMTNSEVGFATASRDKTVKIWLPADESKCQWKAITTLTFTDAATAIDFSPVLRDGRQRLAVGLENGEISIYSTQSDLTRWTVEVTIDRQLGHSDSIKRISWRPSSNDGPTQQLATCSEDCSIRVLMVHLDFH